MRVDGLVDLTGGICLRAWRIHSQCGEEEERRRQGGKSFSAFPGGDTAMRKKGDANVTG
ncbi:hypothetical protein ACK8QS_00995 [Ectopseudomonas mendocina]